MTSLTLIALFASAALNGLAPGPCLLLIAARAALAGPGAGLTVTAGVVTAQMAYMALAWAALGTALSLSADLHTAIQLVGAVLLVHLAWGLLVPQRQPDAAALPQARTDYLGGVMVGLSSPFNLVFMFGVLPQLIPAQGVDWGQGALIVAALFLGSALPMAAFALLVARIGPRGAWFGPLMGRAAGVAFLAFATLAVANSVSSLVA